MSAQLLNKSTSDELTEDNNVKQFFVHDLVYKFDERNRIRFGVVNVSYEDSDSADTFTTLQKGQTLVRWDHSSRKQICKQNRLHLMSRCVMVGDIVRRLQDGKETQRGYCKSIRQHACVQIVETEKVIAHVADSRLCNLKPFDVGDAFILDGKCGRIQEIEETIRMKAKCGSIVDVNANQNYQIRDYWTRMTILNNFSIYPGQTVICTPRQLKDAKWVKKSKIMKRRLELEQIFTVQSARTTLMAVWWNHSGSNSELSELKEEEIKRIKVLSFMDHLMVWGRYLLKIKPSDVMLSKKEWLAKKSRQLATHDTASIASSPTQYSPNGGFELEDEWFTEEDEEDDDSAISPDASKMLGELSLAHKTKHQKRKQHNMSKMHKISAGDVVAVEVVCDESQATIVWQDGTEEKDVPSTELYFSVSLDDHEFFPGECVVRSTNPDKEDHYGVVQKVNFLERTAEIKWFSYNEEEQLDGAKVDVNANRPTEMQSIEMSVYDLKKHAKFVFRPGSVVQSKREPDRLGHVVDSCPEGYVKVVWLDGPQENCWPQHIELIPEKWDEFSLDSDSDDDSDYEGDSWETESYESFYGNVSDEITLQNMAIKVNYIRNRICYLRQAFHEFNIDYGFSFVKDLLSVYKNSSYLDKYLGTDFFNVKSQHFQTILLESQKRAKALGVDMKDSFSGLVGRHKNAEKETLQKMLRLESKINAQIDNFIGKEPAPPEIPATPQTPESEESSEKCHENLCVELLTMLKMRLDLVYAEIISRIGGRQALSVLTTSNDAARKISFVNSTRNNLTPPFMLSPDVAPTSESTPKSSAPVFPDLFADQSASESQSNHHEAFAILEDAPDTHHYYLSTFEPIDLQKFMSTLQREYNLLKESLPAGVWVRTYCDRMDLLSVMICGPANTPYEDGLFLFDIQLSADYPKNPPLVHYISFSSEALNPNLYVQGKVCVSLLGTWMGRDSEVWTAKSTLLQVIVSIQGLILVAEPYYNEAGYERQSHTQQGYENSRTYNELVLLKLVESMTELMRSMPKVFKCEIVSHFRANGERMCERLTNYCAEENVVKPEFSLLPVSKGLKLSLKSAMNVFREELRKMLSNNEIAAAAAVVVKSVTDEDGDDKKSDMKKETV